MLNARFKGPWVETLVLVTASVLLYHIGIGFLVFLIPLQVLYARRGSRQFLAGLGLALASIIAVRLVYGIGPLVWIELFSLAALMGGLALANEMRIPGLRRVFRLLLVTALIGLLSVPAFLYLRANEAFTSAYREVFIGAAEMFKGTFEAAPNVDEMIELTGTIVLRSYLFDYFLVLTGVWWAGTLMGARSLGRASGLTRLVDFHLPDTAIWPLILGLTLVLLELVRGAGKLGALGMPGALGWNLALIFLFLYGLRGMGVLRYLAQRFHMNRGLRLLLGLAMIALLLSPQAGIAFWAVPLLLLSGLGVSETWIKYRRAGRSENLS